MQLARQSIRRLGLPIALGLAIAVAGAGSIGVGQAAWAQDAANPAPSAAPPAASSASSAQAPAATDAHDAKPAAGATDAKAASASSAPTPFIVTVFVVMAVLAVVALGLIGAGLNRATTWSLANALSEDVDLPLKDAAGNTVMNNGAAVLVPTMMASSSRLIALYGLFAILILYLGCGMFVLYDLGTGQALPDLQKVQNFLYSGLTLFAPYVVNKFAAVFKNFAPKGQ